MTSPDTSTSTVTLDSIVLFFDDFESGGLTAWRVEKLAGEAKLGKRNNNHFLDVMGSLCRVGDASWTDYIVKARFALIKGNALIRFGEWENKTDRGNVRISCWVDLLYDEASLHMHVQPEGRPGEDIKLVSTPLEIKPDVWHTLAVGHRQNALFLYIDSKRVLFYEDAKIPALSGAIVVGTTGNAHALFDDIKVEAFARPE